MKKRLRLATRSSPLALKQAEWVSHLLKTQVASVEVEIRPMLSEGDRLLSGPLQTLQADKGTFVKRLEKALLADQADIAVHSLKDMTVHIPEGLVLAAVLKRTHPWDAFVSNRYTSLSSLPEGARVGTVSLRRCYQLKAFRSDINVLPLRGNIATRLKRLDAGEFDALVLACAGLDRLGQANRIQAVLKPPYFLPAVGQGALAVECRAEEVDIMAWLQKLNDRSTEICVQAERRVIKGLGGGCLLPVGVYATLRQPELCIQAQVGQPNGALVLKKQVQGPAKQAERLADQVVKSLLDQGAQAILSTEVAKKL